MKVHHFYFDGIPEDINPLNLVPVEAGPDGRITRWRVRAIEYEPQIDRRLTSWQVEMSLRWANKLNLLEKIERDRHGEEATLALTEWHYQILVEARAKVLAEVQAQMAGPAATSTRVRAGDGDGRAESGAADSGTNYGVSPFADFSDEDEIDFRDYVEAASYAVKGPSPFSSFSTNTSPPSKQADSPLELEVEPEPPYAGGSMHPLGKTSLLVPVQGARKTDPKTSAVASRAKRRRRRLNQNEVETLSLIRQLVGISVVIALVGLVAWLVLPGALRWLAGVTNNTPATAQLRVAFKDEVAYQQVPVSLEQLSLLQTSVTLEGTGEATVSLQAPDATAKGSIRLINTDTGAVSLAAGTVMATGSNGVSYKLTSGVSVRGLDINSGQTGIGYGEVQADRPGPEGNGSLGLITRGGLKIVGGPVTGGTSKTIKLVSQQDLELVKGQLLNQLQTSDMVAKALDNQLLLLNQSGPDARRISRVEIGDTQFIGLPGVGAEVAGNGQFKVRLTAQVKGYSYIPAQLLTKLVPTAGAATLGPQNSTGPATMPPTPPANPTASNAVAEVLSLQLQGQPRFKSLEVEEGAGSAGATPQPKLKLRLNYVRPIINREVLIARLSNLSLSPQEFETLVRGLMAKPELARLDIPALPLALPNGTKRVQLLLEVVK